MVNDVYDGTINQFLFCFNIAYDALPVSGGMKKVSVLSAFCYDEYMQKK